MRYATMVILALLIALTPRAALAADPRSGNNITIGPNEVVSDDLYLAGGTLNVMGTVQGDVVAAGGTVDITGNVTGDVIAAGGTVNIGGQVGHSVRVIGSNVSINVPVGGDVLYLGRSLVLAPGSKVGRDLLVGGESVTVNGQVTRNIHSAAGVLTLTGPVGGDVQAEGGTIHLESGAVVAGNLAYRSSQEASVDPGARVQGQIQRQPVPQDNSNPALSRLIGWLQALVGLFLLGLLFIFLFPGFSHRTVDSLNSRPWQSLGIGLGVLILVPIVAVVVFALGLVIGGWWIAAMALAIYAIAAVVSMPVVGLTGGLWITNRAGWSTIRPIWAMLLGTLILMLVSQIPVVGGIVLFAALLFGLGALAIAAARRPRPPEPMAEAVTPDVSPPRGEVAA